MQVVLCAKFPGERFSKKWNIRVEKNKLYLVLTKMHIALKFSLKISSRSTRYLQFLYQKKKKKKEKKNPGKNRVDYRLKAKTNMNERDVRGR